MSIGGNYQDLSAKRGGQAISAGKDWNPLVDAVNAIGAPSSGNILPKISTLAITDISPGAAPEGGYAVGSILAVSSIDGSNPRGFSGTAEPLSGNTSSVLVCNDQKKLIPGGSGYARLINSGEPCRVLVDVDNVPEVLADCGPLDGTTVAHSDGSGLVCLSTETVIDESSYIWVVLSTASSPLQTFELTEAFGDTTPDVAAAVKTDLDGTLTSTVIEIEANQNIFVDGSGASGVRGWALFSGGKYYGFQLGC